MLPITCNPIKTKILQKLKTKHIGKKILYYKKVTSTMDIAKNLAIKKELSGTLIIAETQNTGRGRIERNWFSPPGGIYFSIILRPQIPPSDAAKINIIAAVAICDGLNKLYKLNSRPKWPNDVIVDEKKICGILIEMNSKLDKINWLILGIGINANISRDYLVSKDLLQPATSIEIELKRKISRVELMKTIIRSLENYYTLFCLGKFKKILNKWKQMSDTLGREVKIILQDEVIQGTAVNITDNATLIVQTKEGKKEIFAGDCIYCS